MCNFIDIVWLQRILYTLYLSSAGILRTLCGFAINVSRFRGNSGCSIAFAALSTLYSLWIYWTCNHVVSERSVKKFQLYHQCVYICVCLCLCMHVSQAPLPTWDGRVPSIKSSVSASKLEMPISLYTAPYLIAPSPSSHHLAHAQMNKVLSHSRRCPISACCFHLSVHYSSSSFPSSSIQFFSNLSSPQFSSHHTSSSPSVLPHLLSSLLIAVSILPWPFNCNPSVISPCVFMKYVCFGKYGFMPVCMLWLCCCLQRTSWGESLCKLNSISCNSQFALNPL